jgi:hypothetical protein
MGQVLHGSATTTEAIRRAIQHSKERPESALQTLRHQRENMWPSPSLLTSNIRRSECREVLKVLGVRLFADVR